MKVRQKKICSGGFVYAELAIALPLLVLLMYGLATVGIKIFDLGKKQMADYVLEEEVHDVLSRLIYDARAAKAVKANNKSNQITFTQRLNETDSSNIKETTGTRVYLVKGGVGKKGSNINYKHTSKDPRNPITGGNYFGDTRVMEFKFSQPKYKNSEEKIPNVLHVTLELQSEETNHKIKINTAIYMPGCNSFSGG